MTKTLKSLIRKFREEFLNRHAYDSSTQFKKELQGQLPVKFELFLEKSIKEAIEAMKLDWGPCTCSGSDSCIHYELNDGYELAKEEMQQKVNKFLNGRM